MTLDIFHYEASRLGGSAHERGVTERSRMVIESVCPSIQRRERDLADEVALTQTPQQLYSRGRSEKSNTKSVCAALYMQLPNDFTPPERFMKALRLLLGITSLGT